MTYLLTSCTSNVGNSGQQSCTGTPGRDERLWPVPAGTTIASKALAELESTWDTLFNKAAGLRGFPLQTIFNATPEQGEDVYETGWDNKQDFVSEGLDKITYMLDKMSLYNAAKLRTMNGVNWEFFVVTDTGKIKGWSDDDVTFKPFSVLSFRVGKRTVETGEELERVPITIVWADPRQWNDYPAVVEPLNATTSWNPLELDGIKDLYAVASSPTTSGVILTLTGFDGVPHEGAQLADFVVYDDSSVAQTVTGVTETSAGVYALEFSLGAGDYTGGLKTQPNATTPYFETPTLASFTIS
jgi:hypothetical protein